MAIDFGSVILSSVMAGVVAILATVLIEQRGGAVGGFITLPTTIVPASIGIWIGVGGDTSAFSSAMSVVPVGMLLNVLFLGSWRILPDFLDSYFSKRMLVYAVASCSVFLWLIFAGISTISIESISPIVDPILIGFFAVLVTFILGLFAVSRGGLAPSGSNSVTILSILARGIAAGGAIGIAVWIAGLGLPFVSGVVSVFPAIFLTTMVSLWLAQGRSVPVGATGPMMLGSTSVSIYGLISIFVFPSFGPWIGSIVSWLISVVFYSLPIGVWTWRTIDAGNGDALA
jgi:hypothetical protein